MTELWHPEAKVAAPSSHALAAATAATTGFIPAPADLAGLNLLGAPWRAVLHTTETGSPYVYDPHSYYGNPYWPHATIDQAGIHQHLPLNVGAYALAHDYGVETNRMNAIQCEIIGYAANIENIDDATLANVASWLQFLNEQLALPLVVCPQGFHGEGEGMVLASTASPIRFSDAAWLSFSGVCGHQHIGSGNDHWDPGRFPFDRCLSLIDGGALMSVSDADFAALVATVNESHAWLQDLQTWMSTAEKGTLIPDVVAIQQTVAAIGSVVLDLQQKVNKLVTPAPATVDVNAIAGAVADLLAKRMAS